MGRCDSAYCDTELITTVKSFKVTVILSQYRYKRLHLSCTPAAVADLCIGAHSLKFFNLAFLEQLKVVPI
jgi:hypothetical protein